MEAHATGTLPVVEGRAIDDHLSECPGCLDRFLALTSSSLYPHVPDCRIVKEIGRGRFGVVYKAWWLTDRPRLVALKVLSSFGAMEAGRFDREIAVLERIRSPGIVHCLFASRTADTRYYLMDFIEGMHLDSYLAECTTDLAGKLTVYQRVCRAVADAHAQGVVHRDLKPSNILVDAGGNPHILDFGICTVASDEWTSWARHTLTHRGDVIGTLKYMSPEQAWGGVASPVTERSDVWALGIMLYEIVTNGGYPYSLGSTPDKPAHEALLERIRKELPRQPRLESAPRSRDLEVLLERSLAWEPHRRLSSARALANDLERYCRGLRIQTQPFSMSYRLRRVATGAAARSRWTFTVIFVAATGLALALGGYVFNVGWSVTGYEYQVGRVLSTRTAAGGAARDEIIVVGVLDDTPSAIREFASGGGFGQVTDNAATWRAVHGHVMKRLASARPKAVVWDFFFQTPQPEDARCAAGLTELETAGVPVVLASLQYEDDGVPRLSPELTRAHPGRFRHGAIVARDMVKAPGEVIVAVKRGESTVIPGLALATLAAVLHKETRPDLEWPDRRLALEVLYQTPSGTYIRERDQLELTKVFKAGTQDATVRPDDLLASMRFELDPPERWSQRTVAYQELLNWSDDRLRERLHNKLVVFGNLRTRQTDPAPDRHMVQYGSSVIADVPGCFVMADAIAGLLDRRYLQAAFPMQPKTFLPLLLLAVMGCLLPIRLVTAAAFDRPRYRRALWIAVAGLAVVSLQFMAGGSRFATVHLGLAGFAFFAPMSGALWVEFVRGRHRVLDAGRRELEPVHPAIEGTITLASRQKRTQPGTEARPGPSRE